MVLFGGEEYWLVRWLFQRGLAIIYLFAFLVAATQFRPLVGEDGLLPIEQYVDRRSFRDRPSLFYVVPSDRVIGIAAWSGVGLSVLAVAGLPHWLPEPYPVPVAMALWATLWLLYLSFVNAGQVFYGYGWESMLLETGFLAIFLGAGASAPPDLPFLLLQWVLFRNMFGAGLIKLRGDDCWRDCSCMEYHYETQPIPNPLSWYVHHLPDRFHRVEVLGNHVVELAIPFCYFAPQPVGAIAGAITIGFQLWLMLTGNFAFLNALTIVQSIATFSDGTVAAVVPVGAVVAALPVDGPAAATAPTPIALSIGVVAVGTLVVALSLQPTRNMLSERQVMNTAYDPLNLVNTYGAFGSITRQRHELVIEGTHDEVPSNDSTWREYRFEGKPTDPERRPPQIAPSHLRLDWQLWFAAMSPSPRRHSWFGPLLARLLENDEAVLGLLAEHPFPDEPPTYVRAVRYRYRFTTPEERAETGRWWSRERVGTYVAPVSLDELDRGRTAVRAD